jgi:Ras-related protein Rab-5C
MFNASRSYKVVFLGEPSVGKSSIVHRFINDHFDPYRPSTIGSSFFSTNVNINDHLITLEIWDTAGQERYRSLSPMYYRHAQVIIIVYDVTDKETYDRAKGWINEVVSSQKNDDSLIYLVGNKIDLGDNYRKVESSIAQLYATEHQFSFLEVSAKDSINIMELFHEIGFKLNETEKKTKRYKHPSLILDSQVENRRKLCC